MNDRTNKSRKIRGRKASKIAKAKVREKRQAKRMQEKAEAVGAAKNPPIRKRSAPSSLMDDFGMAIGIVGGLVVTRRSRKDSA